MSIESTAVRRRNHGSGHSYQAADGTGAWVKLDGVTTLLNEGIPKPALVNWAARMVAEAARDRWDDLAPLPPDMRMEALKGAHNTVRNTAALKGQRVHLLAEQLVAGHEVDVPDELASHVGSAVRCMDDWGLSPVLTETVVYSLAHRYAGTLDMVCTSSRLPGAVILADWKTGSGIYDETAFQLAAYRYAEKFISDGGDVPMQSLGITDTWAIHVRDDGYDIYPMDTSASVFDGFLDVARVARMLRDMKAHPLRQGALRRAGAA